MKIVLLALCVMFVGCSFLEKIAPSQVDETGQAIPGTHDVGQPIKDVAGAIPYGDVVVGGLLLAWNFFERAKANKNQKGLLATIRAIKEAGEDPETQEAVNKIKEYLKSAHKNAEVMPLIKTLIAKV